MVDELNGVPQGQTPATPSDPSAGGGQSRQTVAKDRLQKFRTADGELIVEKLAKGYEELESMSGRHTEELGALRSREEQTAAWWNANMVEAEGGDWVPKSWHEKQAQPSPKPATPGGELTREQINEQLRAQLLEGDVASLFEAYGEGIRTNTLTEIGKRDAALQDPTLSKYPTVQGRVRQLMYENPSMSAEDAKLRAFGEQTLKMIQGENPNTGGLPASLGKRNEIRSFIQPANAHPAGNQPQSLEATTAERETWNAIKDTDLAGHLRTLDEFVKEQREHAKTKQQ